MYERTFIICGIIGLIAGIIIFIKTKKLFQSSESAAAEIIELRKSGNGVIPVVRYEKNSRKYTAVHFRSMITNNYSVGDKVIVNTVPGGKFFFTEESAIYSANGVQFILGGGACLAIGIILYIVLR